MFDRQMVNRIFFYFHKILKKLYKEHKKLTANRTAGFSIIGSNSRWVQAKDFKLMESSITETKIKLERLVSLEKAYLP